MKSENLNTHFFVRSAALLLIMSLLNLANAKTADDPLASPSWGTMKQMLLGEAPVVFDDRVRVRAPAAAEDAMNVPVSVSADEIADIEEILVFADLNPIHEVLRFYPMESRPYIGFRIKLQQASPIRAAVRTKDGVWHVGGTWVDTAGGGCTQPSTGMTMGNWTDTLGKIQAKRWPRGNGVERLRFEVMHPMDTGLAPGIPAFFIDDMAFTTPEGKVLARLKTFEPVSENPVLSLDLKTGLKTGKWISVGGMDNNGNRFNVQVTQ